MNDTAAIRQRFDDMLSSWSNGDARAYSELFTEDADYIAFDGSNQKGRKAIYESHHTLFQQWLKGSRLIGSIESIRFIATDIAIVISSGSIIDRGRSRPTSARPSVQTMVAIRDQDHWQFATFHNTRLRPMTKGFGSFIAWMIFDGLWRLNSAIQSAWPS